MASLPHTTAGTGAAASEQDGVSHGGISPAGVADSAGEDTDA
jgi:hypothetical protein